MFNMITVSETFANLTKEQVLHYSFGLGAVIGAVTIGIFGLQNLLLLGAILLIFKWGLSKRKNE